MKEPRPKPEPGNPLNNDTEIASEYCIENHWQRISGRIMNYIQGENENVLFIDCTYQVISQMGWKIIIRTYSH